MNEKRNKERFEEGSEEKKKNDRMKEKSME